MERRKQIIVNWKLNADFISMKKFIDNVSINEEVDLTIIPSFLGILPAINLGKRKNLVVAAPNSDLVTVGNYTGSTSWIELKDYGVKKVMVGHPEVCRNFGDSETTINRKVKTFLENNFKVILIITEDKTDMLKDSTKESLRLKIKKYLNFIDQSLFAENLSIVYKPTFVGETGTRATAEFIIDSIEFIRKILREEYSFFVGNHIPIIYGGDFLGDDFEAIANSEHVDGIMLDDEKAVSAKYVSILLKYLHKASNDTYKTFYDKHLILDEPLEVERQKQQVNISPFEDYEIDSDVYFKDIDISEEDI